ncbi:hypothetical protein JHK86_050326 [Glycine max]|nr:hypothetical protein JHK86_050326 [Glycine max]
MYLILQPIAIAIGDWFLDRKTVKAINYAYPMTIPSIILSSSSGSLLSFVDDHDDDIDIVASSTAGDMLSPHSVECKNNLLHGITLINCQTPIPYLKLNVDIVDFVKLESWWGDITRHWCLDPIWDTVREAKLEVRFSGMHLSLIWKPNCSYLCEEPHDNQRSDGSHLEQEFEEGGNSTVNANHVIQNEENEIKFEMPQNLPTGEFKDLELLIDGEKMHNFTKKEYDIGDGFGHFGLVVDDAFGMELLRTQDDPKSKVP